MNIGYYSPRDLQDQGLGTFLVRQSSTRGLPGRPSPRAAWSELGGQLDLSGRQPPLYPTPPRNKRLPPTGSPGEVNLLG